LTIRFAQDASIPAGVVQKGGEHGAGKAVFKVFTVHSLQGLRAEQRNVATEHQHILLWLLKVRLRHHHGVPGAKLLSLLGKRDSGVAFQKGNHALLLVTNHHAKAFTASLEGAFHHALHHGFARNGEKHFGAVRVHSGALSGSQDYGCKYVH